MSPEALIFLGCIVFTFIVINAAIVRWMFRINTIVHHLQNIDRSLATLCHNHDSIIELRDKA